jgi:hypothetical protein
MVGLMLVAQSRDQMGRFRAALWPRIFGWLATGVMAAAALAMLIVH